MPWGRVDDDFYDHPKVEALGARRLPCVGLYFLAISWSNRYLTDGRIPLDRLRKLGGSRVQADALVEVGLFEDAGDCYLIHDFLERNKSREQVESERATKIEAGRAGGIKSGASRRAQAEAKAKHSASPVLEAEPKHSASPVLGRNGIEARSKREAPGVELPSRPVPSDSPLPPQAGARPRSRRSNGDTPRALGKSLRQIRDGTPEVDALALASLTERTAAWNAAHPSDPIPLPPEEATTETSDDSWMAPT